MVLWPDPILRAKSTAVLQFDDSLRDLARQMLQLMRAQEGVGLAAPQVGRSIRLFVANHTQEPQDDRVYVNPVLTPLEGEDEADEGCLSLPGIRTSVWRASRVRLDAFDLEGNPISVQAEGFEARVWQHEVDHLNGILLTDKLSFSDKLRYRKKLKELEAQLGRK